MSAAHWHLVLNHIPLLGILLGAALLAYGFLRRQKEVQKASLGLLVVAGLAVIAVYLTGEPSEEVVEGMASASHEALEAHERFAWYGLVAGITTGVVALGTLLYGTLRRQLVRWMVVATLVLSIVSVGLIGYTANLGGKINHPELRTSAPAVQTSPPQQESHGKTEEQDDHEEDT